MLFKLLIIFLFILIFLCLRNFLIINRKEKVFESKKLITFNKKNLNTWMSLTKKERYRLSKQESDTYLDKRKLLLSEITKEYKKISRVNFNINTKEK